MSKKLFIPGPIDVSEDVLEKMATPVISHRSKEASELQKSITEKAKNYSTLIMKYYYQHPPALA